MIDDNRKFIFVENPKTATYSIKRALMGDINVHNPLDIRMATINHNIPAIIKAQHPKKWQEYTSFVVVRNTWDRAHSFFQFYREIANSASYQSMSFDEWVALDCPPPIEDYLRAPMHGEGRFDDVLCQLRYVQDVDEVIVLHSFNSQVRNTELQDGIDRICSILNIEAMHTPTDGNNYGRSNRIIPWRQETIERLKHKYQREIERFGFKEPIIESVYPSQLN